MFRLEMANGKSGGFHTMNTNQFRYDSQNMCDTCGWAVGTWNKKNVGFTLRTPELLNQIEWKCEIYTHSVAMKVIFNEICVHKPLHIHMPPTKMTKSVYIV